MSSQAPAPVSLQTSLVSSSHLFVYSRPVGAATEAASTGDSAVDRKLTRLNKSSNESGASGSRLDLPSISRRSESVDSDGDEKVDDYDNVRSGSIDGTSDHEITENGERNRRSDRNSREEESRDEMSDMDDSVENSTSNGMHLDEDSDLGRETKDVLKNNRKTKKKLEVNLEL